MGLLLEAHLQVHTCAMASFQLQWPTPCHVGYQSRQGHSTVCGKQGRADQEAQVQYIGLGRSEKHWFSGGTIVHCGD